MSPTLQASAQLTNRAGYSEDGLPRRGGGSTTMVYGGEGRSLWKQVGKSWDDVVLCSQIGPPLVNE